MILNNTIYNILNTLTKYVLPAIATLIAALNAAWNWELPIEAILATFAAVETFIGALIGISKYNYDGLMWEDEDDTNANEAEG